MRNSSLLTGYTLGYNPSSNMVETSETQSPDNKRTKLNDGNNWSTTTRQYLDGGGGGGGGQLKTIFFHITTIVISVLYATPTLLSHIACAQRYIDKGPHYDLRPIEFYEKFPFFCFKTILLEMAGLKIAWWNSCGLCASTPALTPQNGLL